MEGGGGEDAAVGDDAGDELRRRDVEGGVVALDTLLAGALALRMGDLLRIAKLDANVVGGGVNGIRVSGAVVRNLKMSGGEGDLERSHLVDHVAVHGDDVGGGGEHVDALGVHRPCRHIVRDDGNVKAHIIGDGGGELCPLEIRPCFGAEDFDGVVALPKRTKRQTEVAIGVAHGHQRALVRDLLRKIVADAGDALVLVLQKRQRILLDGTICLRSL